MVKIFKKTLKQESGFTMIELLVAISVFTIIIAITSGIFITSLRSDRTSIALISANSDAELTLEQMARMIRKGIGTTFETETVCTAGPANCPSDGNPIEYKCLKFLYGNDHITYRWNAAAKSLEWNIGANSYADCSADASSGYFSGIVSENLRVDFANFRVDNTVSQYYPRITLLLRVGANNTQISSQTPFTNLETTISPRNDIRY
ncbi:MAG: type II secretion system GspH family protein [Patescibacteria group bacterium]|nr:type II secretion system GspH family protein [Patescibacteria group bacterium]